MSLVLSRSTISTSATSSNESKQNTEAFKNNVEQNLAYSNSVSNSSALQGMFSGVTIQKIEGCNFNFFLNASKSPTREATFPKKTRVILSVDSESE